MNLFRSNPSDHPLRGPVWVPDDCGVNADRTQSMPDDGTRYPGVTWVTQPRRSVRRPAAGARPQHRGRPTSSGRGACGQPVWVTWSTTWTPGGAVISWTPGGTSPALRALKTVHSRRLRLLRYDVAKDAGSVQWANSSPSRYFSSTHRPCGRPMERTRLGGGADLPLVGLGEDEVGADREAPLLGVAQAEVEVGLGVGLEVEAVAGHPDDRLDVADLPAEVAEGDLALGGEDHVAVPLPRVAGADLGEAPVVEVGQRVHGALGGREVLGAGAGDVEGVRQQLELVGQARPTRRSRGPRSGCRRWSRCRRRGRGRWRAGAAAGRTAASGPRP